MFFANTSCGRISCILDTPVDSRLTVKYFSAVLHVRIASDFFSSNSARGRPKKRKKVGRGENSFSDLCALFSSAVFSIFRCKKVSFLWTGSVLEEKRTFQNNKRLKRSTGAPRGGEPLFFCSSL